MPGAFVCVVGPSGAGKDTLIAGARMRLAGNARFVFATRVVTRPSSEAEQHDTVTPEAFADLKASGAFCVSWEAHGLSYGIPAAAGEAVRRGCVVVANLSRSAIADARAAVPPVRVVVVTAPPAVLYERLLSRGRETAAAIEERVRRDTCNSLQADLVIDNVGAVADHVERLSDYLRAIETGR